MKVLPPDRIQAWERRTIEGGTAVEVLMEAAVCGMWRFIRNRFRQRNVLILAGKGHNGDDALWLGQLLKNHGYHVSVVLSHPPADRNPPANSPIGAMTESASVWPDRPPDLFSGPPRLIIDGLLGLGASGHPREPVASIIRWIQSERRGSDHLISVDVPSGLDSSTGSAGDPCIEADTTLAIAAIKAGLLPDRAAPYVGRLYGLPISLDTAEPDAELNFFDAAMARDLIRRLPANSHKHSRGKVAIWAGSPGMAGAAILASRAALRAGAGLVRCFCHRDIYPLLATATPEVMTHPLDSSGHLPPEAMDSEALLAGPGIGINPESEDILTHLVSSYSGQLILDADALRLIARQPGLFSALSALLAKAILTPHPGEFREIAPGAPADRTEAAIAWAATPSPAILVLKGQRTLVASPSGKVSVNGSGNPGMATAGMGDVLAGIITGLAASGYGAEDAARLGCFWHGAAADLLACSQSEASITAGDVIQALGAGWKSFSEDPD